MAQTSIIITSTDTNNKKLQKTLTYANANASSSVLKSVAQQLNALTTNTYEKTDRIDRINCDTEEPAGQKLTPLLEIGSFEPENLYGVGFVTGLITYNGDGELYFNIDHIDDEDLAEGQPHPCGFIYDYTLYILYDNSLEPGSFSGTVYATEGENYAARSATFSYDPS